MKKAFILYLIFGLVSAHAQQIIDNPKTPLNKKPGRILTLKEVMRIDGEGENYYYNGANELQIDKSGNIYLRDVWHSSQRMHLPKFSPDGKFLIDLYKQGEGPGEIQLDYNFAISESKVFIYDNSKRKIILMDDDGKFVKEYKTKPGSSKTLIGSFKDWLVFVRKVRPSERKKSRLYDIKRIIVFISKDGEIEKDFYTFLHKEFIISSAQGGGMMFWDPFISVIEDNKLYVCSSREYLIAILDLKTGKITTRFKRKYPSVRHELRDSEKKFISKYNAPKKKFEPDIKDLLCDRGYLWIKTSIENKEKGSLFDLYDSKGRFLDSFFINIKGRILKIDGNFLYTSEYDEDYLPYLVKYRIVDSLWTQ